MFLLFYGLMPEIDGLDCIGLTESPKQIWNMDEMGLQLEHKAARVVVQSGLWYLQDGQEKWQSRDYCSHCLCDREDQGC